MDDTKITKKKRMGALSSFMFITEKKDDKVESPKCTIGNKQQKFDGCDKAVGSSLTVSTDGLIVTTAIDVHEGRDVVTMDIPGVFLHTTNDEHITMLLKGKVVELLVQLQSELYRKYAITNKKGEPILYVKLLKAPMDYLTESQVMSHTCDTFQTSFVLELVALSCFGLKLHMMVIMKALLSFYNVYPSIIHES